MLLRIVWGREGDARELIAGAVLGLPGVCNDVFAFDLQDGLWLKPEQELVGVVQGLKRSNRPSLVTLVDAPGDPESVSQAVLLLRPSCRRPRQ